MPVAVNDSIFVKEGPGQGCEVVGPAVSVREELLCSYGLLCMRR